MQLAEGLSVIIFSMGLMFLSLAVLMLAMMALERALRQRLTSEEQTTPVPTVATPPRVETAPRRPDGAASAPPRGELVAAIALTVVRARIDARRPAPLATTQVGLGDERAWDWVWDEGVDDYGTVKGPRHA